MTRLEDEITSYIANYTLQKYEQALLLQEHDGDQENSDLVYVTAQYLTGSHILNEIRKMRIIGIENYKKFKYGDDVK